MKRVLVLGGTGFIGSHVLDVLRKDETVQVMALAHRTIDFRRLEDVNLITGSLQRLDLAWLRDFRPDTILHLARLAGRRAIGRRLAAGRGRAANERLVRWLRSQAPDTHVVYVSGTLVYGDRGELPTDEEAPLDPIAFARQYIRAEEPWMACQADGTLPVTIVRPPWVVGSGSWFRHLFALPAKREGVTPLYGSGGNWMSFLDVRDCAGSIVHLARRAEPGRTFNLFAPDQVARQSEFADFVAERTGAPVEQVETARPRHLRDPAVLEALRCSFVARSIHDDCADYDFVAPDWREMVDHHLCRG